MRIKSTRSTSNVRRKKRSKRKSPPSGKRFSIKKISLKKKSGYRLKKKSRTKSSKPRRVVSGKGRYNRIKTRKTPISPRLAATRKALRELLDQCRMIKIQTKNFRPDLVSTLTPSGKELYNRCLAARLGSA